MTWIAAQPDVVALVQAADVAVAPSLWPEPLSRSVMEPLACGVPVVATRVGGNPEILTGWLARYLVEPHDVDDLAERARCHCAGWRQGDPGLGDRCGATPRHRLSLDDEVDAIEAALGRRLRPVADARAGGARASADRRHVVRVDPVVGVEEAAAARADGPRRASPAAVPASPGVDERLGARRPEVAGSSGHHGRKHVSGTSGMPKAWA